MQEALPGFEAQMKMVPESSIAARLKVPTVVKESSVLCLLYPSELNQSVQVLMIERSHDGGKHSGQIAFPGGKYESEDGSLLATAQRETMEEVGLLAEQYQIVGAMTNIYVPVSNYVIHPYLAVADTLDIAMLQGSEDEVKTVLSIPLKGLFESRTMTMVNSYASPQVKNWEVPAYIFEQEYVIWGASAMILSELEAIIQKM